MKRKIAAFLVSAFLTSVVYAGLESATYINSLVVTNPTGSDPFNTTDDHIRLLKSTIKNTFPNLTGAMTADQAELNKLDGMTATQVELNKLAGLTSSTAELNKLTGVTTTPTQFNYLNAASGTTGVGSLAFSGSPTFTGTMQTNNLTVNGTLQGDGAGVFNMSATGLASGTVPPGRLTHTVSTHNGNYTAVSGDANSALFHANGAGSGHTYTIPANSSVAYAVGTELLFINRDSNSITIAITTDTLILTGTSTTGSRTLVGNGMATALKVESTVWLIAGSGLQ